MKTIDSNTIQIDEKFIQRAINSIVALTMAVLMLTSCGRQSAQADTAAVTAQTDTTAATSQEQTASAGASLIITALKGGAADSFVLLTENHVVVIDTGLESKADKLVEFLKEQGVSKIDKLIITHFDKDHVGGADHVIDSLEVGTVYTTFHSKDSDDIDSYLASLEARGLTETTVTQQLNWETDGITFTIYPPERSGYAADESNNSSLVVKVTNGENSMLFAGDAEEERINELLQTQGLESVILKMPHHGRLAANTNELIEYIAPEYAIITSSKSEPEDPEVLAILESHNIQTYLTRDGNITIIMDANGVTVTQ